MEKPSVSVVMVSYNRPLFLKESVRSLIENAGMEFRFILWDNGSNEETRRVATELQRQYGFELLINHTNIGQQALGRLLQEVREEYFVLTEDDMLWFQPDWLKNLVGAMQTTPHITEGGKQLGVKDEWGILATNVLVDSVNNGGMWKTRFDGMIEKTVDGITIWTNIRAGAGAMIWKTDVLRSMDIMKPEVPPFGMALDWVIEKYDQEHYPMGQVRDTYIYHAASPFYNQLYPKVWKEKQKTQTIKQAFRQWKKLGKFDFSNTWILTKLINGTFREYAEKLHEIFNNGRGRLYSFELAEAPERRGRHTRHKVRTGRSRRRVSKKNN